jgi:hypothetical protein
MFPLFCTLCLYPSCNCVQVPSELIPLFIQLPGFITFEGVRVDPIAFISDLKKAVIIEFKLDTAPQCLRLYKLDGSSSCTMLDPAQTLGEAGIVAGTKLVAHFAAVAQVPMAGLWVKTAGCGGCISVTSSFRAARGACGRCLDSRVCGALSYMTEILLENCARSLHPLQAEAAVVSRLLE